MEQIPWLKIETSYRQEQTAKVKTDSFLKNKQNHMAEQKSLTGQKTFNKNLSILERITCQNKKRISSNSNKLKM